MAGFHLPRENFIIKQSPGKGLGVFATRAMEPGTVIMEDAPTILIRPPRMHEGIGYPLDAIQILIGEAFDALSEGDQADVLSLSAHVLPGEADETEYHRLKTVFRSNAYSTGNEIGLFTKIARINHSCRPNSGYYWTERLRKRVVYATRPIAEGEEISVTYIPLLYSKSDRERRLDQYGFKCACEACAGQSGNAAWASDHRRHEIRKGFFELEPQLTLEVAKTVMARKKAQRLAEESLRLAELVEEEGLVDYYAQAYRVAAIFHANIEMWEPATTWAHKSYQIRNMADAQSEEAIEMRILTSRFIEQWNEELRNKSKGRL
ncbi:SET domain-containing protein [Lindgomyces ingoldianus]|uniref:SET domain-containing protein n=1 Tax=Lindgomyces ingoldianus TaxID=673940 RepID=A0ACB6R2N9_9PLEO|nr:SET domain-containing protein [Lindgomyces ingoldianus]KAF2472701.1 SET domain-containing protein [Lindgomyces ingoldianus]